MEIKVSGPKRPINIVTIIKIFVAALRVEVIPVLNPTVSKAEITS